MRKIQLIKKKWMEWNHIYKEKSQPVYQFMNRFSLIFHAIWAVIINFSIEAMSRHSVIAAWEYMDVSTRVFFYNAFMIFITFSIVYLFKRRTFVRIIISVLWLFLGIVNGVMLLKRVTPFNAQDLKTFSEGLTLFTNYFSVSELVMMAIAFPIVILLLFFL